MEFQEEDKETSFVKEEVGNIVKDSVNSVLGEVKAYNHAKAGQWVSNIIETCMKRLTQLNKPFKYIVTCVILQKNGAGMQTASSCYWDNTTDDSYTFKFENKFMYCIITAYGLAL
eukprot:GEZU01012055.1.p2 GENE.GEZU01012055.1~~GEZU01012055.1.p2  ORF type:complete len:115 (-),score=20.55 GEZU01012055.1:47-391(-)